MKTLIINSSNRVLLLLVATFVLTSCDRGFNPKKFEKVGHPSYRTEQEIVALLGPGSEVKDSYTEMSITTHKLPSSARFLRYSDPSQPGVFYHVVLVDGRLVVQDVWDSRMKP
jgi:hypothetical protein